MSQPSAAVHAFHAQAGVAIEALLGIFILVVLRLGALLASVALDVAKVFPHAQPKFFIRGLRSGLLDRCIHTRSGVQWGPASIPRSVFESAAVPHRIVRSLASSDKYPR